MNPERKLAIPPMAEWIPAREKAKVLELVERRLVFMAYDMAQELDDQYNPRRRTRRAA